MRVQVHHSLFYNAALVDEAAAPIHFFWKVASFMRLLLALLVS
jgi:hypothetical protein